MNPCKSFEPNQAFDRNTLSDFIRCSECPHIADTCTITSPTHQELTARGDSQGVGSGKSARPMCTYYTVLRLGNGDRGRSGGSETTAARPSRNAPACTRILRNSGDCSCGQGGFGNTVPGESDHQERCFFQSKKQKPLLGTPVPSTPVPLGRNDLTLLNTDAPLPKPP